jgi:hypothetical protein
MKENNRVRAGIVGAALLLGMSACAEEGPLGVAPPAPKANLSITNVMYPQAVTAGTEIVVNWEIGGFSDQAVHRVSWFEAEAESGSTSVPATVRSQNALSARFVAPNNSGTVHFILQATDADGRSATSNQFTVRVTSTPTVKILEAPMQVMASESVKVRWSFDGTAMLSSNIIRWGTAPGQYTQNSIGGRLVASGEYADEFVAPSDAQKIYFMVQVVDEDGAYSSSERSVDVISTAASITIDGYPSSVQAGNTIEVRWTVANADTLIENRFFWGSQSGQLTSVSPLGVSTGNKSYVASIVAPSVAGSVFLAVRASDHKGSFESGEVRIQVHAGPAVMLDALPQSTITNTSQDVSWSVTGVSNVSSTVLEWGTATGVYTNTVQGVRNAAKFKASFMTPASANQSVYVRAVAFHALGRTESIEHRIQLTAAPNVTIESAPTVAQTATDVEIVWSFTDAQNVTQNVIRWGDAPGVYTNEVAPTETLAPNRFRTVFAAPATPQVMYFVAQITDARGDFQSIEQSISVGGAPSIEILRAPRLAVAAQVLEVEWRLNNMGPLTENAVRWGPIPNFFLYTVGNVTALGGNRYVARFSAPVSGGLVSLQVRASDNQGSYRSSTHNAIIIPTPALTFQTLPRATKSSQDLTLTWQVSNVSNIDRQFITWGYTSGQLTNQTADAVTSASGDTASIPVPSQLGTLYFAVNIVSQGSTVVSEEIRVEVVPGTPVAVPATQSAVTISGGDEHAYSFPVAQGTTYEVIMRPDATGGDVDLYVSEDANISTTNYDCRPYNPGTQTETCTFTASSDGYAHIIVDGFQDGTYDLETASR